MSLTLSQTHAGRRLRVTTTGTNINSEELIKLYTGSGGGTTPWGAGTYFEIYNAGGPGNQPIDIAPQSGVHIYQGSGTLRILAGQYARILKTDTNVFETSEWDMFVIDEPSSFVFQVGAFPDPEHLHHAFMSPGQAKFLIHNTNPLQPVAGGSQPSVNITTEIAGASSHQHTITVFYDYVNHTFVVTNITNNTLDNHEAWLIGDGAVTGPGAPSLPTTITSFNAPTLPFLWEQAYNGGSPAPAGYSEGGARVTWNTFLGAGSNFGMRSGTAIVGKKYCEFELITHFGSTNNYHAFGLIEQADVALPSPYGSTQYSMFSRAPNGSGGCGLAAHGLNTGGTETPSTNYVFDVGDRIGIAFDAGSGKIWYRKNGVWIDGDPSTNTGESHSAVAGTYRFAYSDYSCNVDATMLIEAQIYPTTSTQTGSMPTGFSAYES